MKRLIAQKIKFLVVGFAAVVMFCPALLQRFSASSDRSDWLGSASVRDQTLILFKRGALDTRSRADLDTAEEDRRAMSIMSVSSAKTRVVQFAGPIRPAWLSSLLATGAEII